MKDHVPSLPERIVDAILLYLVARGIVALVFDCIWLYHDLFS